MALMFRRRKLLAKCVCGCTTFVPRLPLVGNNSDGDVKAGFIGECVECRLLSRVQNGEATRYKVRPEKADDDSEAKAEERLQRARKYRTDADMPGLY